MLAVNTKDQKNNLKTMKTTLLSFCVILSSASMAQTFQWDTNDTITTNLALNTTEQYPMYQSAIGTDTVVLGIEIIYNDLPAAWDGMVCIYGQCLGSIPPVGVTATMAPIYGSNQGMVRLTVNPYNGTEQAKLQVYVYDVNFPNDGDTATFLLNETASLDLLDASNTEIAPNPVKNIVSISSDYVFQSVAIKSLSGDLVYASEMMGSKTSIDVSNLPSGVYVVRLSGDAGTVEKRLVKL